MIVQLQNLSDIRSQHRNEKIVLTMGTFDLLHVGHLRYLNAVKALGDIMVVLLSSDDRVRARKGPERPIIPEADRAQMLDALKVVDYVFIDPSKSQPTEIDPVHAQIVAELQPDICAADGGRDSRFTNIIAEDKFRIIELKRSEGYPVIRSDETASTSAIINHIVSLEQ
ncbi:MAG: rfaE bifunctional protein [Candidatus Saccharibacteria bacterium]|nr:rfaE bifunctional protein [Candidatus Saccharibacteria bacterium]